MNREEVLKMSDDELDQAIRMILTYDDEENEDVINVRFEMSGCGSNNGHNIDNMAILNLFNDCGIYDYVTFLVLDAYKGHITAYWKWAYIGNIVEQEFGGFGTIEIIREIIKQLYVQPTLVGLKPRRD